MNFKSFLRRLPANSNRPPGEVSDFEHRSSRGYVVVISCSVIIPIVTIFMVLRIFTKSLINKSGLGKEDCKTPSSFHYKYYFISRRKIADSNISIDAALVSWGGFVVFNAFILWMVPVGFGVHEWNVRVIDGMHFAQVGFFNQFLKIKQVV